MSTLARHLNKSYGFSCQTWIAIDIADRYFDSSYRTWFSTTLNPERNGNSSNPLIIYQELDKIVHMNDYNHSRIEQIRLKLCNWIAASPIPPIDIVQVISEVISAPIPAFRPKLWKIDLTNIHISRIIDLGQFPDEYLITNLIQSEIEVIVE